MSFCKRDIPLVCTNVQCQHFSGDWVGNEQRCRPITCMCGSHLQDIRSQFQVKMCPYMCVLMSVWLCVWVFSPRAACVHAAMIMRDSLSWKAIWGSKGKPRCSSLKIHPVLYCSQKHRDDEGERSHTCLHAHAHTQSQPRTEERGRREEACSPGNYIILLTGLSNTLSSPTSGCIETITAGTSFWRIPWFALICRLTHRCLFYPGKNQQHCQHFGGCFV